jgi:branched-subunit amino acid ABC-type transport system permease component
VEANEIFDVQLCIGISLYRIAIFASALVLFFALNLFFRKTIIGKIVVAALEDK